MTGLASFRVCRLPGSVCVLTSHGSERSGHQAQGSALTPRGKQDARGSQPALLGVLGKVMPSVRAWLQAGWVCYRTGVLRNWAVSLQAPTSRQQARRCCGHLIFSPPVHSPPVPSPPHSHTSQRPRPAQPLGEKTLVGAGGRRSCFQGLGVAGGGPGKGGGRLAWAPGDSSLLTPGGPTGGGMHKPAVCAAPCPLPTPLASCPLCEKLLARRDMLREAVPSHAPASLSCRLSFGAVARGIGMRPSL